MKMISIASGSYMFINDSGILLKTSKGEYNLKSNDYSLYLLPLLEKNPLEFKEETQAENQNNLELVISKLINFPFMQRMDYWVILPLIG